MKHVPIHAITSNISMTIFTDTETILTSVCGGPEEDPEEPETLRKEKAEAGVSLLLASVYVTHLKAPQDVARLPPK